MRLLCVLTAALACFGAVAAGGQDGPMSDDITIGVGIICNTSAQMQRLIGLRADGAEITHAVNSVNDEAMDPRACGVAAVAFFSGEMVAMRNVQGKLVQIVRINVVAAFDGRQWTRIPSMTQYALVEPDGYMI